MKEEEFLPFRAEHVDTLCFDLLSRSIDKKNATFFSTFLKKKIRRVRFVVQIFLCEGRNAIIDDRRTSFAFRTRGWLIFNGGAFGGRSAAGREGVLLRISLPLLTYIQNAIMAGQNETLSNNRLNSSFELNNLDERTLIFNRKLVTRVLASREFSNPALSF